MIGQGLIHLADIIASYLELNQAWTLRNTCRPCAQTTIVVGIALMVDGKRTKVGTVQWLRRHLTETVVAYIHVGDVWQGGRTEVIRQRCQLVESEVDDLQEIGILALDRTLRNSRHLVATQVDGCNRRTCGEELAWELLYLVVRQGDGRGVDALVSPITVIHSCNLIVREIDGAHHMHRTGIEDVRYLLQLIVGKGQALCVLGERTEVGRNLLYLVVVQVKR